MRKRKCKKHGEFLRVPHSFLHKRKSKAAEEFSQRIAQQYSYDLDLELYWFVCLFVFVALRPMSTAMVIAGRSVHLTTLFPGQA